MDKKLKTATIQELDEMIKILKNLKTKVKGNKVNEDATNFFTEELDKVYYDFKSLEERTEFCFKK